MHVCVDVCVDETGACVCVWMRLELVCVCVCVCVDGWMKLEHVCTEFVSINVCE